MSIDRIENYYFNETIETEVSRRFTEVDNSNTASEAVVNTLPTILDTEKIRTDINNVFRRFDNRIVDERSKYPEYPENYVLPVPKLHVGSASRKAVSRLQSMRESWNMERSIRPRAATQEDIPELVEVDIKAFNSVYKHYDMTPEELRQDLSQKFTARLNMVGSDWVQVLEKSGKIVGFMTCCPTNKGPEDFVSWEETTNDGTLEGTYDPDGKFVYLVSLSMLPEGSFIDGQNMLFANLIGKFIKEGYSQAYFESRMPMLRKWVKTQCRENGMDFEGLTDIQKDAFAEEYYQTKRIKNGKEELIDPLLQMYVAAGNKVTRLVPNAYQDELSMNYGAVCVFDNPLPTKLKNMATVGKAVGQSLRLLSKSHWLMKKVF